VEHNTYSNRWFNSVKFKKLILIIYSASDEDEAFEICKKLDVDYVLLMFGGATEFSGDDINKFYWILRITGDVYPHIKWENY